MKKLLTRYISLAALFLLPGMAFAQSGGPFELNWQSIDGGGGTSGGGQFTLSGTIGQPDAGVLTGGGFQLEGGFLNSASSPTTAAPILKINLIAGGQAIISWPKDLSDFSLEFTTDLTSGLWTGDSTAVVDTSTERTVTVPAIGTRFYRLKK